MNIDKELEEILYDHWARHRYCKDGCQVDGENQITLQSIKDLFEELVEKSRPKENYAMEDYHIGYDQGTNDYKYNLLKAIKGDK